MSFDTRVKILIMLLKYGMRIWQICWSLLRLRRTEVLVLYCCLFREFSSTCFMCYALMINIKYCCFMNKYEVIRITVCTLLLDIVDSMIVFVVCMWTSSKKKKIIRKSYIQTKLCVFFLFFLKKNSQYYFYNFFEGILFL